MERMWQRRFAGVNVRLGACPARARCCLRVPPLAPLRALPTLSSALCLITAPPPQALNAVTDAAAASLYEMATSKYGSFVARRLLCVLAGRDVAPPPGEPRSGWVGG